MTSPAGSGTVSDTISTVGGSAQVDAGKLSVPDSPESGVVNPRLIPVVFIVTAGLLYWVAFRGWIPHDEGTLGQAAIRVLNGEWPHADFLDVYPGMQGIIHAGVFAILGPSIASLRIAWLIIASIASIGFFDLFSRRFSGGVSSVLAVGVTVLGFVIYPASMPSWWNLTLAVLILALTLRGADRNRWMVVLAGLLTGLSILIKTTGGVFVAIPVFLWLGSRDRRLPNWLFSVACAVAAVGVVMLVAQAPTLNRFLLMGLPALFGVFLIWRRRHPKGAGSDVLGWNAYSYGMSTLLLPLGFAGIYASTGRLSALFEGWVISPALRFEAAEGDVPLASAGLILGLTIVLAGQVVSRLNLPSYSVISVVVVGVAVWTALDWVGLAYYTFIGAAWLPLFLVGFLIVARAWDDLGRTASAVLPTALMFTLIQFPLWNGFYAAYTIPLVVGSTLLITRPRSTAIGGPLAVSLALVLLIQSITGFLVGPRALSERVEFTYLATERARISVPRFHGYYAELAERVADVTDGRAVYAGPDAPEVAFLAGVPSATPGFFEILDLSWEESTPGDLATSGVPVVVNHSPVFSLPIADEELSRIYASNANRRTIGKFELTWSPKG